MTDDLEKANAIVKQAEKDRVDTCAKIVYDALKEFDCIFQPEFFYRGGQWRDRVLIVSRPENVPPVQIISSNGSSSK